MVFEKGNKLSDESAIKKKKSMEEWWAKNKNSPKVLERNKKIGLKRKGFLHTDESKRKMSINGMGRIISEKTKEAVRKRHTRKIVSIETRKKMSESFTGKEKSITARQNMSLAAIEKWKDDDYRKKCHETKKRLFTEGKIQSSFKGKHHTQESKEKSRISHLGKIPWNKNKTNIYSEETLNSNREKHLGKPNIALKGKPKSKEQNKKSSETKKKNFKEGLTKSWNIGLTKETDERVLKYSEKLIGKNAGEKHRLFNNWSSLKPYTKEFNKKFKEAIKERDGCCMLCNIGYDDLKLLKRKTHIHHIDYNKLNSFPQNCISLCNSCHSKTNFNKNQWTTFFQSLMKERYNYKFSEDQKIIFDFDFKNKEKGGKTKC